MKKQAQILTFGCRLNQSESNLMENQLRQMGYQIIPANHNPADAVDLYVINSCTVTDRADKKCNQLIRSLKKKSPTAKIALTGCYAQTAASTIEKTLPVDWILGNNEKMRLDQYLKTSDFDAQHGCQTRIAVQAIPKTNFALPAVQEYAEARVNLKIQDGCDFFCSFCIIPFARGRSRSRKFEDIIAEAQQVAKAGYKELVLTGVNLGLYKYEKHCFATLVQSLAQIEGIKRIRISSIEPTTISEDFLTQMADPKNKIAPFLHLPIQAAHDNQLKAMRRKYSLQQYDDYIKLARKLMPSVCLGTDLIVGFPNETEQDFQEALAFLQRSELNFFHVFPYSRRTGTLSDKKGGLLPQKTLRDRAKAARDLSQKKWLAYQNSFVGKTEEVVLEKRLLKNMYQPSVQSAQQANTSWWIGHSAHYLKVKCQSEQGSRKENVRVRLVAQDEQTNCMVGIAEH